MIKRVTEDYVQDIIDTIDAAMQFVQDMTFTEFENELKIPSN